MTIVTRKPACCRSDTASACWRLVTFGTCDVAGPFETVTVTFVPWRAFVPPCGSVATTSPFGWSDASSTRATLKPAPSSALCAFGKGVPTTFGIPICFGPCETFRRTFEPASTFSPPAGASPTTVETGAEE